MHALSLWRGPTEDPGVYSNTVTSAPPVPAAKCSIPVPSSVVLAPFAYGSNKSPDTWVGALDMNPSCFLPFSQKPELTVGAVNP